MRFEPVFLCIVFIIGGTMLLPGNAAAQDPNNIVVIQIQPPQPYQLSMADLWNIILISNLRTDMEIQLHGSVEAARDGLIGTGNSSFFMIQPGMNRLTGRHVEPVSVDYADNRYRDALLRTGGIPPGEYTLCVWAIDPASGRELGRDCIRHQVESFNPPELISPIRGANIRPDELIFTWTPLSPIVRGVQIVYEFRLVEMLGNQPPEVAVQANPGWFETSTSGLSVQMTGTSARYNRPDPGPYAWSVIAKDETTDRILGRSEVSFFTIVDDEPQLAIIQGQPPGVETGYIATLAPHGIPLAVFEELLTPCSGTINMALPAVLRTEDKIIITGEHPQPGTLQLQLQQEN